MYVDVDDIDGYVFYYNVTKKINECVAQVLSDEIKLNRPMNQNGFDNAIMGSVNLHTGDVEYEYHSMLEGITTKVNYELAEEILELAKFYCPKDTGYLAESGRIEQLQDGSCRVYFDCPYAWYVHEFTWREHKFPTCAKFLTRAKYEVEKAHGFGWA